MAFVVGGGFWLVQKIAGQAELAVQAEVSILVCVCGGICDKVQGFLSGARFCGGRCL